MFDFNKNLLSLEKHLRLISLISENHVDTVLELFATKNGKEILQLLIDSAGLSEDYFEDFKNRKELVDFVQKGIDFYQAPFLKKNP